MIIGVVLRNFKTYKPITFLPISNGEKFCGLIGENGIGKSSILESLDFFFNDKQFKKNINSTGSEEEYYVVPIFAIEKDLIEDPNIRDIAEKYSTNIWAIINEDIKSPTFNYKYLDTLKSISEHIESLNGTIAQESHYLLPVGEAISNVTSIGLFRDDYFRRGILYNNGEAFGDNIVTNEQFLDLLTPLKEFLKSLFQYVYIPKDIEPERFVQFETNEIQTLLGTNLDAIVQKFLSKGDIQEISNGLKDFVNTLSDKLPGYKFRTLTSNQPNLKADKIYSLITRSFFSLRELHKEGNGGKDIPLRDLSSGEKQQAILSVINNIISEYRSTSTKNLIIAVDEPEGSLHISACYDQFEKLYNTSCHCRQLLFASHWYGFIPAMNSGTITNVARESETGKHKGHIFNIFKYREEIKHENGDYAREHKKPLPIDISLKSSNDLVQSILYSVINDNFYNWIICEGSSDKIYLEAYLKDEIKDKNLRIIPVGSASEVKKIYDYLSVAISELLKSARDRIKGKVFMLFDTDSQFYDFDTHDELEKYIQCRRIVNAEEDTSLVKISSNPKSPKTDIEDALNGKIFNKTLLLFKLQEPELLDFVEEEEKTECCSFISMNLRVNEYKKLDDFFSKDRSRNKVAFAQNYVEILESGEYIIPKWISEIKTFFNN